MPVVYIRVLDLNQTLVVSYEPEESLYEKVRELLKVEATQPIHLLKEDQMWLCTLTI